MEPPRLSAEHGIGQMERSKRAFIMLWSQQSVSKQTFPHNSHSRPVLGSAGMPQEVGGLGDLEEESARQKHVAVLVREGTEVVELSCQFALELLEGPAQDFSDLLSVLLAFRVDVVGRCIIYSTLKIFSAAMMQ